MKMIKYVLVSALLFFFPFVTPCSGGQIPIPENECTPAYRFDGVQLLLSNDEWKEKLNPEQFRVLRKKGTEPAYQNAYYATKAEGIYACAGCLLPLFSSASKYDSGTGWPSFMGPVCPGNVSYSSDFSFLGKRIAVSCSRCEGHLGHVFNDGPPPSGKRYCMNSAALQFIPKN